MATQIKQWVTAQDGLDNVRMTTAPMPVPKDGEVLVKINTVSLNYRDTEGTLVVYENDLSLA
jgi:NADPH:quinone reductase-like Zn-dependent oxidoreductase